MEPHLICIAFAYDGLGINRPTIGKPNVYPVRERQALNLEFRGCRFTLVRLKYLLDGRVCAANLVHCCILMCHSGHDIFFKESHATF